MAAPYHKRFDLISNSLTSSHFHSIARFPDSPNSFTRTRKFPLNEVIYSFLFKRGLTATMEVYHYLKRKGSSVMTLSKQAFLSQRKKVNPEAFRFLNLQYLSHFYTQDTPKTWHNYLVFAIDGSRMEVPNSKENRLFFSQNGNRFGETSVRAQTSGLMDVFNAFLIDLQIDSLHVGEKNLAKKNLLSSESIPFQAPRLVLFDRGYPSLDLIHFIEKQKLSYLIRIPSTIYQKERAQLTSLDSSVFLSCTYSRLRTMKRVEPELAKDFEANKGIMTRMIQLPLENGQMNVFMTNLPATITREEILELYKKRWAIEKLWQTVKNKLKIEQVSGKSPVCVYQDFLAQSLVYNMVQDVMSHLNQKETKKKINENIAIGLWKDQLIDIVLEKDDKEKLLRFKKLEEDILRAVYLPRDLQRNKRKYKHHNKYKQNQKPSF
ncbi:IS4 family transposase [Candidatus Enterococcus clewellii]|uniref:Transposase IS4-like domain-containing protein n=2 Tax=Candidatus Enterococcus clewellii TaxID=1834193 RepID=A0A242K8U9_9ENTE|nr:IS4 family transposase [Enterococcus sp. 9E7_DIV0242]OTP14365.1 hypothetical protein A5888_002466 [Enterococcus sp. 9E7_DIV0242]OTP17499.1 hypothetical protein A5888_001637 [Enterococcus sp. 9E7_DIV0242]OTP17648.1 hypothetical protein A5888_001786 [Enterococcus sp. 9E7_DIV0242]